MACSECGGRHMLRPVEIITYDSKTPLEASGWAETVGERKLEQITICEFGPAEETIALIFFADGTAEVGIGESMRPYDQLYSGTDDAEAVKAFWDAVTEHSSM